MGSGGKLSVSMRQGKSSEREGVYVGWKREEVGWLGGVSWPGDAGLGVYVEED